jgi:hypothetical protein
VPTCCFFPDRISGETCCELAELSYIHLSRYVFPTSKMFLVFPSVGSVVPKSSSELKWWVNHSSEEQKSHFETSINKSEDHFTMKELCLESQHF